MKNDLEVLKKIRDSVSADDLKEGIGIKIQKDDITGEITISSTGSGGGSSIEQSNINGNIIVDSEEIKVYDDTNVMKKSDYASESNEGYVKKADEAKMVEALKNAQPNMYLGTDSNGNYGAYRLPFSEESKDGGIYQMVLLNPPVNSPQSVDSMIDLKDCKIFTQAYKFVAGEQDVISTLKEFNNANKDSFFYDSENVDFENGMKIKNQYICTMKENGDYYISDIIYKNEYIDSISILSDPINTSAIKLNGSTKVEMGNLGMLSNFTLDCWVKFNPVSQSPYVGLLGVNSGDTRCGIRLRNEGSYAPYLFPADNNRLALSTSLEPYSNIWTHIAFAIDGNNVYFYINGELVETKAFTLPCSFDLSNAIAFCNKENSAYLNGSVDEFKIWNKTLTQEEVQNSMKNKMSSLENLLVYYTFDEVLENVVENKANNELSGTLIGTYIEDNSRVIDSKLLLHSDSKYYTIKDNSLNEVDITSINESGFTVGSIVYNYDILPDHFSIISELDLNISIVAIKSNKELIVASNNFSAKIADHIDYFKAVYEKNTNSSIKLAFSIDNGLTWKGNNFEDLNIEIPLKVYSELSEEEKTKWNNAKESIYTNGISIEDLESLDFNTLNFEYIRFAYVLSITNVSDICNTSKLQWQFDAKGSMQLMDSTEVDVEVLSDSIKITPKTEEELIKVNITNGTCSGLENPSQDESLTNEEIKTFVSGILS